MSTSDAIGGMNDAWASLPSLWPGLGGVDSNGSFLNATRCGSCAWVMLGARQQCSRCWATGSLTPTSVGRKGRVYSRTVIHAPAPGFVAPYAVGYIDLPEGIRVFAHLQQGPEAPMIGDDVELVIMPLRESDGNALTGPVYRRVNGSDQ